MSLSSSFFPSQFTLSPAPTSAWWASMMKAFILISLPSPSDLSAARFAGSFPCPAGTVVLPCSATSGCGVNVAGVAAVAQKLFFSEFWSWVGAGDVGLPFSPHELSTGWLTGGALKGSPPPAGQVAGNVVCARPQVMVRESAVSKVADYESMSVLPPGPSSLRQS